MKTYSIPIRERSSKSDYACPDGEIAGAMNLRFTDGCLRGAGINGETGNVAADGEETAEPEAPAVEFALRQGVVPGWHIHPDMLPSQIVDAPSEGKDATPTESDWGERAMQTIAAFEEDASRNNLFTQPFFALAAWRLADGSHICHTAPALMIPNSGAPVVEGSADFSVPTMKMSVVEAACRLQWKYPGEASSPNSPVPSDNPNSPIVGIDIFVSEPITLYDEKDGAKGYHRFECTNFTRSIGADGNAGDRQIYTETITQGWKTTPLAAGYMAYKFRRIKTFSLVAEMSLEDIGSGSEADASRDSDFEDVPMGDGCLNVLWAMETYTPDFSSASEEEEEAGNAEDMTWREFIPGEWELDSVAGSEWGVFVTRPLKLDNPEERKQLLSVALRGNFDRSRVSMALYSSEDLIVWRRLLLADRAAVSGLWATKGRFFRLAVKTRLPKSIEALVIIRN